jgi:hypothetical protein
MIMNQNTTEEVVSWHYRIFFGTGLCLLSMMGICTSILVAVISVKKVTDQYRWFLFGAAVYDICVKMQRKASSLYHTLEWSI